MDHVAILRHETRNLVPRFPYRPHSTALLIIDMQRYFTQPGSTFMRLSATRIPDGGIKRYIERLDALVIPNIRKLQWAFRKNGDPVLYTRLGSHRPDGTDLPAWARRLNEAGRAAFGSPVLPCFDDSSTQLDERIMSRPDEPVLSKTTTGVLASSSLEVDLRARGVTSVVVAGVLSALCVSQTARELSDRDFEVALVEEACASLTETAHEAALAAFSAMYGWVPSMEEMIAAINGQ